ncbi:MAG: HU family DNA-binding protein [Nitrospirae bacterium]|nr:HU family DNA-binding protein [Nitrospirota bacterium]
MTKAEFVDSVQRGAKGVDLSKKAMEEIIDCIFETASKAIRKDKRFVYPDFGTFTVRTRKARTGRNPRTGEALKIKASKTVGFKPAPKFKGSL